LHEYYDIPVWHVENCGDRESWEYPEPTKRIAEFTGKSMRKLAGRLREVAGFEITDDMLREAQNAKRKLDSAVSRVRKLVENSDPMPLSPSHENIWMCLRSLTLTIDGIAEATEAINLLYEELQERVTRGEGVVEKNAPRVLAILPAGQTDPRMEYLACEVGIAIVAIDMSLKIPFKEKSEDPYVMLGLWPQQFTLGATLSGRIPLIINACKNLRIEGVLDRYHTGCRSVVADALILEEAVRKELGIPVLTLEWENFDPRSYNHEQFKSKFELFKSMMIDRRT
jgi:benzoyl-CoA reductase/2-hydroxyglutaryl-CoA dehydratase subunit BcrC/BadD/HgdB